MKKSGSSVAEKLFDDRHPEMSHFLLLAGRDEGDRQKGEQQRYMMDLLHLLIFFSGIFP